MLTDLVGTSVLTFAGVASKLGWLLTIVFIVGMCPIAVYTAVLMSRTRGELQEPLTMGEAGRQLWGDRAATAVYVLVYGVFAFSGNASYLLILGQSLQGSFYDVPGLCLPTAVLIACLCTLPIVVSVRHLSDSVWMCFGNLFLIVAVLAIVICRLIADGRHPDIQTFLIAEDLTFLDMFGAMTNILYAYAGHWLYFELMAEMTTPDDFPRVFIVNAPFQVLLYLVVACTGYYYQGNKANGYFLDNLPNGTAYRCASALLFLHVTIAFLIKNVVLARFLHGKISPVRVEECSFRARLEHAACATSLVVGGFFTANAIPFFNEFLGIIGGLLSGPISFLLPIFFFLATRSGAGSTVGIEFAGDHSLARSVITATVGKRLNYFDAIAMVGVVALVLLTMFVGTYSEIHDVIKNVQKMGGPFSCKPLTRAVPDLLSGNVTARSHLLQSNVLVWS